MDHRKTHLQTLKQCCTRTSAFAPGFLLGEQFLRRHGAHGRLDEIRPHKHFERYDQLVMHQIVEYCEFQSWVPSCRFPRIYETEYYSRTGTRNPFLNGEASYSTDVNS